MFNLDYDLYVFNPDYDVLEDGLHVCDLDYDLQMFILDYDVLEDGFMRTSLITTYNLQMFILDYSLHAFELRSSCF